MLVLEMSEYRVVTKKSFSLGFDPRNMYALIYRNPIPFVVALLNVSVGEY